MTPVEFLRARYDELERWAKACAEVYPPPWEVSDRGWMARVVADEPNYLDVTRLDQEQAPIDAAWLSDYLEHIAGNDPAYVLADLASKRAILEWFTKSQWVANQGHHMAYAQGELAAYRTVLLELLKPFAGHRDYDPNWAA